jgi:gas vesicle protein
MDKNTTKKFALGTIIAAAAGYIAGVLTAPKSGKETREDIKNTAAATYSAAEKQLKALHTELNQLLDQAKAKAANLKGIALSDLEKAMTLAKMAKEKTRDVLSAVHEGGAEDKDLQTAIKEANKAVDHLKKYLQKV